MHRCTRFGGRTDGATPQTTCLQIIMATKEVILEEVEDEVEDEEEWPETSDVKTINVIVLVFVTI